MDGGFIEIFKKLLQKKKEVAAMAGGGAAPMADTTQAKGYGEELSPSEIKEMGRSYIGQAPGRIPVLQQFLQKARKKK